MPRNRYEPPAVRVYTVCDESKFVYLIVRNVPALGCGNELSKLFGSYGDIEECKPMDGEECESFTDVFWIKFLQVNNARFAKRKLDESVFLGNRLQVSYAPQFESLSDTKQKLEGRRKEVLARLNPARTKQATNHRPTSVQNNFISEDVNFSKREYGNTHYQNQSSSETITTVSSNQEYFPSQSMNQTVNLVREKLNKIHSSADHSESGPSKKSRVDNRRRI